MEIKFFASILVTLILVNIAQPHFRWAKKLKKIVTDPFKTSLCRVQHHRTLLDRNNNVVGCKRRCPRKYVERYSLHWGHHCKPIVIPEGCADEFCMRCSPGYKWMYSHTFTNQCVKECPTGYMALGNMCERCTIDDCDRCSSMWRCTKCSGNMALYETFMGSTICVYYCRRSYRKVKIGDTLKCVRRIGRVTTTIQPPTPQKTVETTKTSTLSTEKSLTETTIKMTETGTTKILTTKPALPEGCKDLNCIVCEPGYLKFYPETKGNHCVKKCPPGYNALGSLCVACSDRRCASCKASLAECDKCFPGYSMLLDSFNITLECVRTCPEGYEQSVVNGVRYCLKSIEPECPVANCAQCVRSSLYPLHKGCVKCINGFSLFRGTFNDHCYTTCPPGFYQVNQPGSNSTACAKCHTPFCSKCSDSSTCLECVEPMVLDAVTKRCTTCPPLKEYSFQDKKCVFGDLNRSEHGDENDIFGFNGANAGF